jgi:hypothetical protein
MTDFGVAPGRSCNKKKRGGKTRCYRNQKELVTHKGKLNRVETQRVLNKLTHVIRYMTIQFWMKEVKYI